MHRLHDLHAALAYLAPSEHLCLGFIRCRGTVVQGTLNGFISSETGSIFQLREAARKIMCECSIAAGGQSGIQSMG